jgi:ABC-type sugar transport system permease subunit
MSAPDNLLSDPKHALWGPIAANVWWGIPFFAITLLAALQSIPRDIYEAAAIDGAGAWVRFRSITLPYLAPTMAITILLRTVWIANFADLIVVMTKGGPADSTQILASYIFTQAFQRLDFRLRLGDCRGSACCCCWRTRGAAGAVAAFPQHAELPLHPRESFRSLALHYALLGLYLAFALFPLYWLLKVSLTPNESSLRRRGAAVADSRHARALRLGDRAQPVSPVFPQQRHCLRQHRAAGRRCSQRRGLRLLAIPIPGQAAGSWGLMLVTQMFPLVMIVAPIFRLLAPLGPHQFSLTGLVLVYTAFNVPFASFSCNPSSTPSRRTSRKPRCSMGARAFRHARIIVPLTLPGLAATLGFVFTAAWSELLFALMLNSSSRQHLPGRPAGLRVQILGGLRADDGGRRARAAAGVRILFLLIQRHLVQGLTAGAVKG